MSVIALSSCAAAPFAHTSAANSSVLIFFARARLLRLKSSCAGQGCGWRAWLARSIDALDAKFLTQCGVGAWFLIAHNSVRQPGTPPLHMQPGRGRALRGCCLRRSARPKVRRSGLGRLLACCGPRMGTETSPNFLAFLAAPCFFAEMHNWLPHFASIPSPVNLKRST